MAARAYTIISCLWNKEEVGFLELSSIIDSVKGVGPARAALLHKLGIKTVHDALFYFPRDYIDMTPLNFSQGSEEKAYAFPCVVSGSAIEKIAKSGIRIVLVPVFDGKNRGHAVFFNQPYIKHNFRKGEKVIFIGKVRKNYGEYEIVNPEWQKFDELSAEFDRIVPIYPLTKGLSQRVLRQIIKEVLTKCEVPEILPREIIERFGLLSRKEALKNIHFPQSFKMLEKSRERFAFEEILLLQMALIKTRRELAGDKRVNIYSDFNLKPIISSLPFSLTSGQQKVVDEIVNDLKSEKIMNRLIQGDVGSGKTVVACIALYLAVKNGLQGAFMVPTEILAEQHFMTLKNILGPQGIRVDILKGGMSSNERADILKNLKSGKTHVIVGTHAIIEKDVDFLRLGMVITDEQHRFGVRQRRELIKKGHNPDVLVMSATPIPRTLALVLYSDLDISIIDVLPEGRQKVETFFVRSDMRKRVYAFMLREIEKNHQAYIVCPAVEENELDVLSVEDLYANIKKDYPSLKVGMLHGKMRNDEKEKIIKDFLLNKIQVLISTTVIEVGVDVPNATLMIIENAERFGMAQLHQLRGRVGRSSLKSYCILISDSKEESAKARLNYLMKCHDGFEISRKDLELRGPGEFFGLRQHGFFELKIVNHIKDFQLLEEIKILATNIIDENKLSLPEYDELSRLLHDRIFKKI